MFLGCERLESVGDLSLWTNVELSTMSSMFDGCINLQSVGDISNWKIPNEWHRMHVFRNCKKLKKKPSWAKRSR